MNSADNLDTVDLPPLVTNAETECPAPSSSGVRVDVGALTDRGKLRNNNEDHFLVASFGRSLVTLKTNVPENLVPDRFDQIGYALVVADGMGGAAAGEVASSMAISVGVNLALNSPKWTLVTTPDEIRESMETWRRRFRQIDQVLADRADADPSLAGMGTTLTIACSVGANLLLYHVGDSRAYLFRHGRLHLLTHDHTLAQQMADAGCIPPEEVARHRLRHVLTRVLGRSGGDIEAEIQHVCLADGDRILLCTDGLTEMVSDERIAEVLRAIEPSEEACRALIAEALAGGGKDNVTVVLAHYGIPAALRAN